MKKTTALAAVLAVSIMLSACSKKTPETSSTTTTEETTITVETTEFNPDAPITSETSEPSSEPRELHEPNLFGNPIEDPFASPWFYRSLDASDSWIRDIWAVYGLLDWTEYGTIVAGSELTVELMTNTDVPYGSKIKLYIFAQNDDYAWNTQDAYASFTADFCRTVNGDQYFGKTDLPTDMPTGVYTLVVVHEDGTVDCMYDFDVVETVDEAGEGAAVMKPVIYLYPEESTEVSVSIDFDGDLECTYPQYDPVEGWRVIADPDGHLYNLNDDREYDYLFWDGTTYKDIDSFDNAICVKGSDTAKFLEEYLEAAGLNSSEIDDFVSFWLPMMQKNNYNIISFPTEEYEEMAKLNVSPAPDTVIRVYMVFAGIDEPVDIPADHQIIMPEKVTRDGFTLVEWGGSPVEFKG